MQTEESTKDNERPVIKTAENANIIAAAHAYFGVIGDKKDIITYKDLKEFKDKTNITNEKDAKEYVSVIEKISSNNAKSNYHRDSLKKSFTQTLVHIAELANEEFLRPSQYEQSLKANSEELKELLHQEGVLDKTLNGPGSELISNMAEKSFKNFRQKEGKKAFVDEQTSVEKEAANKVREQLANKYGLSEEDIKNKSIDSIAKIAAEKEPLEEFEQLRDKEGNETGLVQRNVFSRRGEIGLGNRYEMKEMLKASGANYDDEELNQLTSDIAESFTSGKLVGGEFTQKAIGQLRAFMRTKEGVSALDSIRKGEEKAKQIKRYEKEAKVKEEYETSYENTKSKIAEDRLKNVERNIEGERQRGNATTKEAIKKFEKDTGSEYTDARIKALEKMAGRESAINRMIEGDKPSASKEQEKQSNNSTNNSTNNSKSNDASPIPVDAKEIKLVLQIGDELVNAIAKIIKG